MVWNANISLQKMNDRYILIRDTTPPLELNIIDNYLTAATTVHFGDPALKHCN